MRTFLLPLLVALAFFAGCGVDTAPNESPPTTVHLSNVAALSVPWTFTVESRDHRPIASLTVLFTEDEARSCVAGNWKRLVLVNFRSLGEPAFPGTDPLSYQLFGSTLTIGRNEVCDGYLMLSGELADAGITGDYYSRGLGGGDTLGYFTGKPTVAAKSVLERSGGGQRHQDF